MKRTGRNSGRVRRSPGNRGERALITLGILLPSLGLIGAAWGSWANQIPDTPIPAAALPADNARDHFIRAASMLTQNIGTASTDGKNPQYNPKTGKTEKVVETPADRDALARANDSAFAELRVGLSLPYVEPAARSFTALFPHYAKFRALARALAWTAHYHAERGEYEQAAQLSIDAIALGRKVPHHSVLIGALVGVACEAIGRRSLYDIADQLDPKSARVAIARLEALEKERFPFSETLIEEKWATQGGLREIFRKGGASFAQLTTSTEEETTPGQRFMWTALLAFANKRQVLATNAAYMDSLAASATQTYSPTRPAPPEPTDIINRILVPVFSQASFKDFSNRADDALLRTYLAASAYKKEKGALAPSADALVQAGYLTTVPVDPFSTERAPIVVTSRHGKPLIFSVGPDAVPDEGRAIVPKRKNGDQPVRYVEAGDEGDMVARINTY